MQLRRNDSCVPPSFRSRPHAPLASLALLTALVLATIAPSPASAQRLGAQRFGPAGSEDGIFETEGADRRALLTPYVALWANYALNPLVVVDGEGRRQGAPIEHLLAFDLVASMAIWEGLEVGVALPVTALAIGDDDAAQRAGIPAAYGPVLGDASLRIAYRIRIAEDTAIALHVPVLFPTSPDDNTLSLGLGVRPTLAFLQRFGPLELLINVGALVRESAGASDYRGGSEAIARIGARVDVSGTWSTALLAEVGGSTAFEDPFSRANTPVEARGGLEHWIDSHWRVGAMAGAGFGPGVGSPDFRGALSVAYGDNVPYRPRPSGTAGDRDGDGIADESDECPNEPEDPDGYEDEDGCPDTDNDRDGILDVGDECPSEPETMNEIADEDGCPDFVRFEEAGITTFQPVYFRTGSDEILERSHPMLREIAGVLRVHSHTRIRVEGHTDAQGDDAQNLELSRRRAESVRRFLIEQGLPESQIEAEGYGETRPIDTNDTEAGRGRNRRVEFHVIGG